MYELKIYIGSPNDTGRFTKEYGTKIVSWLQKNFSQGFTILRGIGGWRDEIEDAAVITMISAGAYDVEVLEDSLKELLATLDQISILYVITPVRGKEIRRRI